MKRIKIRKPERNYELGKLLGLLWVYGNIVRKNHSYVLEVYTKNKFKKYIEEIGDLLSKNFGIEIKIKRNKLKELNIGEKGFLVEGYYIHKSCRELCDFLLDLGFNKDPEKINSYLNKEFAKGIFDGFYPFIKKKGNRKYINSLNQNQLKLIKIISEFLGYKVKEYKYRNYFYTVIYDRI